MGGGGEAEGERAARRSGLQTQEAGTADAYTRASGNTRFAFENAAWVVHIPKSPTYTTLRARTDRVMALDACSTITKASRWEELGMHPDVLVTILITWTLAAAAAGGGGACADGNW